MTINMNTQKHEKMYRIIQQRVLNKYLNELAEAKPSEKQHGKNRRQLFEVYEYEESDGQVQLDIDYDQVEEQIKGEISRQYNQYLCDSETSDLKMQIFLLDKQIQIELDQIELLQSKIKNCRPKLQHEVPHSNARTPVHVKSQTKSQNSNRTVSLKQNDKQHHKMCLVPNIRVDIAPQSATDQKLDKTIKKQEELMQLLIKDIQLRNNQVKAAQTLKAQPKHFQPAEKKSKVQVMNDLILAQRSILESKQNWISQKQDHKKAKETKRKLKQQLARFWQHAEMYQTLA